MRGRGWFSIFSAVFLAAVAAVAFCLLVAKIQDIIALFAIAFVLAYVLDPILDRLQTRGWSRARAVWTVMLLVLVVVGGLTAVIVPQLIHQTEDVIAHWPVYTERAMNIDQGARDAVEAYVKQRYPDADIMPQIDAKVQEAKQWLVENLPTLLKWASGRVLSSLGLVGVGAIVTVLTFHFMMVIDAMRHVLVESMPRRHGESIEHINTQINAMLGQFVRGEAIVCVLVGISATVLLTIVRLIWGTNYGLIVGCITGVTYAVPYVGPAVSASLAGFFGYVTATHDPLVACLVSVGAMILVNQSFDVVITPKIVGGKVGLHPLIIMFSVFAGLKLLGVVGMVIATPLAASIKIVLLRWLPIKGLEEGEALPKHAPLAIDVAKSLTQGMHWARDLGHRIEQAITHESNQEPPQE